VGGDGASKRGAQRSGDLATGIGRKCWAVLENAPPAVR